VVEFYPTIFLHVSLCYVRIYVLLKIFFRKWLFSALTLDPLRLWYRWSLMYLGQGQGMATPSGLPATSGGLSARNPTRRLPQRSTVTIRAPPGPVGATGLTAGRSVWRLTEGSGTWPGIRLHAIPIKTTALDGPRNRGRGCRPRWSPAQACRALRDAGTDPTFT